MREFTYQDINYRFYGVDEDHIFRFIGHPTFYEFELLKHITSLDIKGVYVDVGANIGNHSVYFANHCPSTKVISFEPERECFYFLQLNMKTNSTKEFEVHSVGAWNESRKAYLKRFPSYKNMGQSKIVNEPSGDEVYLIPLDGFIKESVALIKIDVEGAEEKVINGAKELISRCKPVIVCEGDKVVLDKLLGTLGYPPAKSRFNATPTYVWTQTKQ